VNPDRSSRRYVTIEEVYRRYGTDLLRFLHGAHPHLNVQDAEDLLHQAILKAVAHMEQYDPERGSLRLWIFGILRNEVRQDLRRRRPVAGEVPDVPSSEPSAEAAALAGEKVAAVEAALAALSFAERESLLVVLRTEGRATTEETAARLGIAPGSVAVYRQRARERLREALSRRGLEDTDVRGRGAPEQDGGETWRNKASRVRTS
jgi:RNA polymerase sigma-70 factor (ECF subfamily)